MAKVGTQQAEAISGPRDSAGAETVQPVFDAAAFEQRLGHWRRIAFSAILSFRNIPLEDAEDIFQELSLSYWAQHDRINNPELWFFVCARKKTHRFVTRRRLPADPVEALAAHPAPGLDPDARSIQQVFFSLSAHCRRLLGCLVMEDWSVTELASATRRNPRDLVAMGSRCIKSLSSRWRKLDAVRCKPGAGGR